MGSAPAIMEAGATQQCATPGKAAREASRVEKPPIETADMPWAIASNQGRPARWNPTAEIVVRAAYTVAMVAARSLARPNSLSERSEDVPVHLPQNPHYCIEIACFFG